MNDSFYSTQDGSKIQQAWKEDKQLIQGKALNASWQIKVRLKLNHFKIINTDVNFNWNQTWIDYLCPFLTFTIFRIRFSKKISIHSQPSFSFSKILFHVRSGTSPILSSLSWSRASEAELGPLWIEPTSSPPIELSKQFYKFLNQFFLDL